MIVFGSKAYFIATIIPCESEYVFRQLKKLYADNDYQRIIEGNLFDINDNINGLNARHPKSMSAYKLTINMIKVVKIKYYPYKNVVDLPWQLRSINSIFN